jgi:Tfp pilus assembly protein PilF/2-polyprenyl-3-methyl-5-hydroxy-6-metoxy-1,4-benzoquinol methylase
MKAGRGFGGGPRIDPRYERMQHMLGLAAKHQRAGRFADAERAYRAVVAEEPRNVAALNNLARTQQALGRPAEAETNYRRALAIAPNEPRLLTNLGNSLAEQGREAEAIAVYQQTLTLAPAIAEVHNNLGGLLHRSGDLARAEEHYRHAIALSPQFADPYGNLARARLAQGDIDDGLRFAVRFMELAPGRDAQRIVVHCLRDLQPPPGDLSLRPLVERALVDVWDRPEELGRIAAQLVVATVATLNDPDETLAALASDKLLAVLLSSTPVAYAKLEHILTGARQSLLRQLGSPAPTLLPFACALAQQCFLNEYVFIQSDTERAVVAALRDTRPFTPFGLAVLASYEPLHGLPKRADLLKQVWPSELRPVLQQQIVEPLEEEELRASIDTITPIDNTVSQVVRGQYEENPYPRWLHPAPAEPAPSISHLLRAQFPAAPFAPLNKIKGLEVLIAGCGTGRQPIEVARQLPGSRVLAVDLSLASLGYARRKTRELGVQNVEFAQADLVQIGSTNRSFDLIQATGVLHHLQDPMEGWRVLVGMLRPRGVMQVGLYSERARQPVIIAREFIAERGFRPLPEEIRRCRQEVLARADDRLTWITTSRDFYYLSACRDLLFHVQECRLTLPEIAQFLRETALVFLGFELEPAVATAYRSQNPADTPMTDLVAWHEFELKHPGTFRGMYQFWVQKPS